MGAIAPLLSDEHKQFVEVMNNKAQLLRLAEREGIILPKPRTVGMLTYGGPQLGTPLVEQLVCMGCEAHISGGAYMRPGGRHHYVFCYSVKGQQQPVACCKLMPYYLKKYIMKNFKEIHEQSKKYNSMDKMNGGPDSGAAQALAAQAMRALEERAARNAARQ